MELLKNQTVFDTECNDEVIGEKMHELMCRLFPINRSLTGEGVRQSLAILQEFIPLKVKAVKSGTKVFDWEIPKEWNIREAYIEDESGEKIVDMKNCNLHIMGYSTPVNTYMDLDELLPKLISMPDQPELISYVSSYYKENWGFSIEHNKKINMRDEWYHVVIDSSLEDGVLNYGELMIPGKTKKEVLLSTYICHPSMANNELSGPVVMTYLAKCLLSMKERNYTYRILFLPETIGAVNYIYQHYDHLREYVIAGYVLTTIGDSGDFSFVSTRYGDSLADRIVEKVLSECGPYKKHSFLERGSDERQYNSPGVDLGIVTVTRTKFGTYPEYHTSADNLDFIKPHDLAKSLKMMKRIIEATEVTADANPYHLSKMKKRKTGCYQLFMPCEPQLGKRGLYPTTSHKGSANNVRNLMNFLAYADGCNTVEDISYHAKLTVSEVEEFIEKLKDTGILNMVL